MKNFCLVIGVFMMASVICPIQASAQSPVRVTVSATAAPIFVIPETARTPLRLAKEGSILNVVASEGEWYRVEFHDPQWGRRVGYIEKRHVNVQVAAPQQAVDLSVAESRLPAPNTFESAEQQSDQVAAASGISFFPAAETVVGWSVMAKTPGDFLGGFAFGPLKRDSGATSALGWMAAETRNLTPWFGLVGDVSGNYSNTVFNAGASTHTFLSGARFTGRPKGGRVSPFGQFLAGIQYTHVHGLGISESLVNFAIQPGGGVDIKLSDSLAVRVQLDHRTSFHDGFHSGAFRFAPGIVISRGRKAF